MSWWINANFHFTILKKKIINIVVYKIICYIADNLAKTLEGNKVNLF